MRQNKLTLLAAASLFAFATAAAAQDTAPAEAVETAETTTDSAAEMEFLKAQVEALQAQIQQLSTRVGKAEPSWKGAPQWQDKDAGWSFKLRGRLMYDVAWIDNPGLPAAETTSSTVGTNKDLGFNSRIRRARLGVEGTFPGNFSYKVEADFANSSVSWADAFVEWKSPKGPFSVRAGHFETFQSLEQITSSRHIMFLERAQMNDAFGHGRRLGGAIGFDQGDLLFRAGIFNDSINSDLNNDEWLFGTRLVYAPKMGSNQLHFGVNYQHRQFSSTQANFRYRARPFVQTTGTRFVDTNSWAAKSDDIFGVEAAGIFGPLHVAAEGQMAKPNSYAPSHVFSGGDSPGFGSDGAVITRRLASDPEFKSFYVEAGYWLTGETRGYKKGEWDRTKVLNGLDKGGLGAIAITARYDYLDLADRKLYTGGVGTSTSRGGKQTGYLASIVWQPIDYVRITAQYAHADIEGGPFASTVEPTSADPTNERSYGVDSVAMRVAFDF